MGIHVVINIYQDTWFLSTVTPCIKTWTRVCKRPRTHAQRIGSSKDRETLLRPWDDPFQYALGSLPAGQQGGVSMRRSGLFRHQLFEQREQAGFIPCYN